MYNIMSYEIKLTPDQYHDLLVNAVANKRRINTIKKYTESKKGKDAAKRAVKKYRSSEKGKKK